MTDIQYIENVSEGSSLQYNGKVYRVQNDKGWLFIFATVDGKRKKVDIKKVKVWFDYGSEPDWIFNEWYRIYPEYEIFKQYADNEKLST